MTCPCGCEGLIDEHDDRAEGVWTCPRCGEDSDSDLGKPCKRCMMKGSRAFECGWSVIKGGGA